ncbi:MAG: hypothetical protein K2J95_13140 [Lachnospiraceae bacterium]|nr:hypothetical protein [Lachnospiraceae bacterium]
MRIKEEFPIDEDLVKEFIEGNKKIWKSMKHTNGFIFINLSMVRMQIAWLIPKLLYAKGIEETTGCKVIVFTWRENSLLKELFQSFGFYHIALNSMDKRNAREVSYTHLTLTTT